jgi:hypothetical protein
MCDSNSAIRSTSDTSSTKGTNSRALPWNGLISKRTVERKLATVLWSHAIRQMYAEPQVRAQSHCPRAGRAELANPAKGGSYDVRQHDAGADLSHARQI